MATMGEDSTRSRTLRFPDSAIRGRVYYRSRGQQDQDSRLLTATRWRRLGEASGLLTAPHDVDLKLVINARYARNLGWLSSLSDAGLTAIEIRGPAREGEQLRHIASLPDLEAIALTTRELTSSSIAALASISTLRELRLGDLYDEASITTDALAPLESLSLRDLHLCNIPLRSGILGRLRSLATLRLTHTARQFGRGSGPSVLGEVPGLQHLYVAGNVDDEDLRYIGRLSNLVTLEMMVGALGAHAVADWSNLTKLRELRLDGLRTGDERLAVLSGLPALESLALPGIDMRRAGMDALTRLRTLRTLKLTGAIIHPREIQAVFALGQLEHLDLSRIETPIVDLNGIGKLTALRRLALDEISSPVEDIAPLQDLAQLEVLHLGGNRLSGATGALGGLLHLRELALYDCELTDIDVAVLSQLRSLRLLTLGGNHITDAAGDAIAQLGDLRELNLSATGVTDACFAAIARLLHLHTLDLLDVKLTGDRFAELGALQELGYLRLSGANARHLVQLGALSRLESLVLDHVTLDAQAARAIAGLPSLQRLELMATPIDDDVARELTHAVHLETMSLTNGSRVSGDGFGHIARLPALRRVDLSRSQIDDAVLQSISAMRSLEHLDLTGTDVTDAGLQQLASVASLEHLTASGPHVAREGLAALASQMPNCWYVGQG